MVPFLNLFCQDDHYYNLYIKKYFQPLYEIGPDDLHGDGWEVIVVLEGIYIFKLCSPVQNPLRVDITLYFKVWWKRPVEQRKLERHIFQEKFNGENDSKMLLPAVKMIKVPFPL